MGNVLIALSALLQLTSQATQLTQLLQTAQAEGRDLTAEELGQVQAAYAAAHTQLDADIAKGG
jgi:hypothetical protein